MDLFSCRNCIYNPSQGLMLGTGRGYCMKWRALIERPEQTTCKYLHRKDLPYFLAEEAHREHAEEFAACAGMADLESRQPLTRFPQGEDSDTRIDPLTRAVITYQSLEAPRLQPGLLNLLAGSTEGRRSLAYASLVRGAIHPGPLPVHSWDWVSGLLDEIDRPVLLDVSDLVDAARGGDGGLEEARWEVFYTRLSGLQEVGWHAAIDELKFPMGELGECVGRQDWNGLIARLGPLKERWRAQLRSATGTLRPLFSGLSSEEVLTDRAVSVGQSGPVREVLH